MLLEVKGIKKTYQTKARKTVAVNDVSFSLGKNDFVSVVGRSGSGKSTLLNMLTGLLAPTSGAILFEGADLRGMGDLAVSRVRNERMGYVPQGYSVLANLTLLDNVCLPFYLFKREGAVHEKARDLLGRMGIAQLADRYPAELSGGEIRRAAIARALINDPAILIADEPTGDLDEQTTGEIMRLFKEINTGGTAILMVTHEPDTVAYGNRLFQMAQGKLEETQIKELN
ncbi:MAG TPA: ABC transporter ATP-binding protein [Clostridiales bacterium]|nr:ABC transporter ATP-binding protein [Clostridiales bacterium]